jgi:predicted transcriptional regulator of viral defense system
MRWGGAPYFLSFATAFELHRMTTQPSLVIYVSSPRRMRAQAIGKYQYRFVLVPKRILFGLAQHWVTKDQAVAVSDVERTILDGLREPAYVGGITEVAKGLWMKREKLSVERLIDYVSAVATSTGSFIVIDTHVARRSGAAPAIRHARSCAQP